MILHFAWGRRCKFLFRYLIGPNWIVELFCWSSYGTLDILSIDATLDHPRLYDTPERALLSLVWANKERHPELWSLLWITMPAQLRSMREDRERQLYG